MPRWWNLVDTPGLNPGPLEGYGFESRFGQWADNSVGRVQDF